VIDGEWQFRIFLFLVPTREGVFDKGIKDTFYHAKCQQGLAKRGALASRSEEDGVEANDWEVECLVTAV
jgi:hypothetical protein